VRNLFRSSAPDNLADLLGSRELLEPDHFILYDSTLLIDLRSPSEVDEAKRRALIEGAPGGKFEEVDGLESMMKSRAKRQLLSLKNCDPGGAEFLEYVSNNYISSVDLEKAGKDDKLELVIQAVKSQGLKVLLGFIIENELFICTVLKAVTIHMEGHDNGKILIYCAFGKDRTGIIAMLCQSHLE
jgi:hypothetical protein